MNKDIMCSLYDFDCDKCEDFYKCYPELDLESSIEIDKDIEEEMLEGMI